MSDLATGPADPLDLAGIDDLLSAEERAIREAVRRVCDQEVTPTSRSGSRPGRSPTCAA